MQKVPSVQLTISKPSIKDLLDEVKGFKYQITMKLLLNKYKENADRKFAPVYFNSTTKIVTNSEYDLNKSFQKVF